MSVNIPDWYFRHCLTTDFVPLACSDITICSSSVIWTSSPRQPSVVVLEQPPTLLTLLIVCIVLVGLVVCGTVATRPYHLFIISISPRQPTFSQEEFFAMLVKREVLLGCKNKIMGINTLALFYSSVLSIYILSYGQLQLVSRLLTHCDHHIAAIQKVFFVGCTNGVVFTPLKHDVSMS